MDRQASGGMTALHLAAQRGHVDVCHCLLAHGANPALANAHGHTVREVASDAVRQLLQKNTFSGAAINGGSREQQLLEAARAGDLEIVKVCANNNN